MSNPLEEIRQRTHALKSHYVALEWSAREITNVAGVRNDLESIIPALESSVTALTARLTSAEEIVRRVAQQAIDGTTTSWTMETLDAYDEERDALWAAAVMHCQTYAPEKH